MVKPFSLAVLYAKAKALVKREKGMVLSPVLHVGDIELDPSGHTVSVQGKEVDITPKEYILLRCLMEHKGRVFGREDLLIAVWGYDFEGTDRVVDNHIKKLRKLLGKCGAQIKTVRKAGYSEWEGRYAEWMQLDRFGIVAAVYDNEGNEILHSDVASYQSATYGEAGVFPKEIYERMLTAVEQAAADGMPAEGTVGIDPFGYHYNYDRTMITTSEGVYWLCFGSISAPWLERQSDFIMTIIIIFIMLLLFTFLPSGYYYMLYRKRLEAERYYRHTAWALAHDLKTPLTAISGYAQNLQEDMHTEKRTYYTGAILKNIDHMSAVIENMLELARLQNTKIKLRKETISMYELTKEVLEPLQGMLEEKGPMLDVKGNIDVSADRALLKRALGNLIHNAINYTNRGENIRISMNNISMNNREYQIANMGVLLTKEQLKKIRDPFIKGEESRGSMAGSGIGLTIVDEIMRLHGFKWKLESDRHGGTDEVRACIHMLTDSWPHA